MNIQDLRALLPVPLPKGQTIKQIKGKFYLYQQARTDGKLTCTCLGLASDEQTAAWEHKDRARVISWLIKNEALFLDALKLLTDLKSKAEK